MKKNRISKNWINKQRKDIYVRKSKIDGYRARSVYKLIEINEKFKIFKNGISVIDLGASPGSWSQYIAKSVKNCRLVSNDIRDMNKIDNSILIKCDFTKVDCQKKIKQYFKSRVDVVVSDMAVNTTGIQDIDAINEIVSLGKKIFKNVKIFKPKSSRKESKESFIICKNLR